MESSFVNQVAADTEKTAQTQLLSPVEPHETMKKIWNQGDHQKKFLEKGKIWTTPEQCHERQRSALNEILKYHDTLFKKQLLSLN